MKKIILLLIIFTVIHSYNLFATNNKDQIILKSGEIVNGKIVEHNKGSNITIITDDGVKIVYPINMIEKVEMTGLPVSRPKFRDVFTTAELGFTIGTPAGINLVLSKHKEQYLFRFSGMYWGSGLKGLQMELGYKFSENRNRYHAINILAGLLSIKSTENQGFGTTIKTNNWQYFGIAYNFNLYGFYLQPGFSIGEGNFTNPQLMFQIGYVYRIKY